MERHKDHGRYIDEFLDVVWVSCPRCQARGEVITRLPYWRSTPRFVCSGCALILEGRHSKWFGPGVGKANRRCARCSKRLSATFSGAALVRRSAELRCQGCGAINDATVVWPFDVSRLPLEPSFGLSLRLQKECAGELLWGYNPDHLRFIRDYVTARVRERLPNRNASLISRLPKWIKQAKNRQQISTAIDVMLQDSIQLTDVTGKS